ncbi:MAG TPA: beta-ketoacyl synthase N-terminal-like domain-containing protein [Gemmatimonadales bacterium]|nr:beta-ketoacyl synthase N-terminal-like domain-containing protein [Gemmatimonadales bacterium]
MNPRVPIHVVSLGASTPVGRDAWSSAAAVRAGVSGLVELPDLTDSVGEPVRVALAPWLDLEVKGVERFEALLFPALEEALGVLSQSASPDIRPVLALGLPSPRPGLPTDLEPHLRAVLIDRFAGSFSAIAVFPVGHAAGFLGLHAACSRMDAGAFQSCVVAGVESYLAPETLRWLEQLDQLHGAGRLNNAWGFIPGEGAAAALVLSEDAAMRAGIEPLAKLLSVGRGMESRLIKTETVCIGEGLTSAFREGLAGLPPGARVTDVYCDMNGEPYRADEFGFACLRTKEAFESASDFVAPADSCGDVSAASASLHLALSVIAARKSYANGPFAFLWASSESGERGSALVATPAPTAS